MSRIPLMSSQSGFQTLKMPPNADDDPDFERRLQNFRDFRSTTPELAVGRPEEAGEFSWALRTRTIEHHDGPTVSLDEVANLHAFRFDDHIPVADEAAAAIPPTQAPYLNQPYQARAPSETASLFGDDTSACEDNRLPETPNRLGDDTSSERSQEHFLHTKNDERLQPEMDDDSTSNTPKSLQDRTSPSAEQASHTAAPRIDEKIPDLVQTLHDHAQDDSSANTMHEPSTPSEQTTPSQQSSWPQAEKDILVESVQWVVANGGHDKSVLEM
ncbi:hypothetical protein HDK77DRAFT_486805 [Phyllosticta capitalensis]|uniref:uncharacterized protein n=1 Tax=Phyllosticta capitalensis TaxID=121624 RepID=UPI003131F8E1